MKPIVALNGPVKKLKDMVISPRGIAIMLMFFHTVFIKVKFLQEFMFAIVVQINYA